MVVISATPLALLAIALPTPLHTPLLPVNAVRGMVEEGIPEPPPPPPPLAVPAAAAAVVW